MILNQIEQTLNVGLFYVALVVTLSLPDICGALLDNDGRANSANYKAWYAANLQSEFPPLTPEYCYSLRCGVLHQGRSEIVGAGAAQTPVVFKLPDPNGFHFNNIQMTGQHNVIAFEVAVFCDTVIEKVRAWYATAKTDANVAKNIANLVRMRKGYPPLFNLPVWVIA